MRINEGFIAGIRSLIPSGTNSTMFTECCETAICNDEPNCPRCKRKVVGWDAESQHQRGIVRWRYATSSWDRKKLYA